MSERAAAWSEGSVSGVGDVRPLTWRERGYVAAVAALMTAGHSIAVPFVVNQNQYFVHAVGDTDPALASDYLVGTTDPYPVFTAAMRVVYSAFGTGGVRLLAPMATFAALIAIFLLARQLVRRNSLGIPVVAMMLVGATLSVGILGSFLPYDWSVSAFQGFAGQYILMKPGYFQPSTAGVFVLLAFPLLLAWFRAGSDRRLWQPIVAVLLILLACALAPTYLVVTAVALGAAMVADLVAGSGWRRLPWYAGIGFLALAVTIASNPAILGMGGGGPDAQDALRRFAFELFPLHTLFSNWPPDDSSLLLAIAVAVILTATLRAGRWLGAWLIAATSVALLAAAVVYVTRNPTLAVLFPWRVSVIIVPVAATVIAIWLATMLAKVPHDNWRWKILMVAAVIAIPGIASTVAKQSPAVTEAPVAAAVDAAPQGTGLIPLPTGTLRLNARLPVYVDAMSPPYASTDLVEWFTRVDNVREFESDPQTFCNADWASEVDWMLLSSATDTPSCADSWTVLVDTGEWRVLQRS